MFALVQTDVLRIVLHAASCGVVGILKWEKMGQLEVLVVLAWKEEALHIDVRRLQNLTRQGKHNAAAAGDEGSRFQSLFSTAVQTEVGTFPCDASPVPCQSWVND